MILIISAIVLGIGIVLLFTGWYQPLGLFLTILSVFLGFFFLGLAINVKQVKTEVTPLKIIKNELGTTIYYLNSDKNEVQTIYTSDIRIANTTNVLYVNKVVKYNSYNLENQIYYILSEK